MAAIHPIELRYKVTPVDNGTFGVLGDMELRALDQPRQGCGLGLRARTFRHRQG